jgi:hypothetical protein
MNALAQLLYADQSLEASECSAWLSICMNLPARRFTHFFEPCIEGHRRVQPVLIVVCAVVLLDLNVATRTLVVHFWSVS